MERAAQPQCRLDGVPRLAPISAEAFARASASFSQRTSKGYGGVHATNFQHVELDLLLSVYVNTDTSGACSQHPNGVGPDI